MHRAFVSPSLRLLLGLGTSLLPHLTSQEPTAPTTPTATPANDPKLRPRPADATALFAMFARSTGLEATFEEEKHLALLALPLRSKGHLYFYRHDPKSAGYLARLVDEPEPSSVLITPTELRLQNRDHTEVVDLARSDKVRSFITSLVHVFAGEAEALAKAYEVTFAPDAKDTAAWTLTLKPRDKPLNQMLQNLRLIGAGEAVLRIEILEPNGDRTVTRILTADARRTFDQAEQKRLFGIDPK